LMASTGKSVSTLVGEIPGYTMLKTKFDCSKERIARVVAGVCQKYHETQINDSDGARVDFADGWVHVRGSNTEPIIRVIAEALTSQRAESLIADVRQILDSVQ